MFHVAGTNVVGLSVDGKGEELDEQNGKTTASRLIIKVHFVEAY